MTQSPSLSPIRVRTHLIEHLLLLLLLLRGLLLGVSARLQRGRHGNKTEGQLETQVLRLRSLVNCDRTARANRKNKKKNERKNQQHNLGWCPPPHTPPPPQDASQAPKLTFALTRFFSAAVMLLMSGSPAPPAPPEAGRSSYSLR